MTKQLLSLLLLLLVAIPVFAQHREPVATTMNANGKMLYVDFAERDLLTPEPQQHVSIQKAVVFDFQCVPSQPNPPAGNARFYCDSGTNQMVCKTSTGANCLGGGGGGGGSGTVTSVGLAGPTGIGISGSPVTGAGTLQWSMPSGWVLGDLLIGNGSNSVARLAAPTTPDTVTEMLISTPSGGATLPQWALAGLPGRVVSGTTDTIVAADRTPQTIEYTSNSPTAITVPDPASTGFNGNPSFVTIAEGAGPYTFTPQTSAVITYCDGSNCFAGQPSLTLQKGQYGTWSSPTTSNWFVRVASTQPISQPPIVNGLISGGGVTWTGLLNFTCSAATYAIGGTVYNSPQTNLTLSAADPTNPRIDVIAVDNTGACVKITGTPAGSPAAPSVDPTSQLSLTFVTIAANATTPTLSSILVYDENSTPPTEYTCTPTANFNCNSTNNPFHLTHDIEATAAVATNSVSLVNSGTVNFSTYSTLSFNIRNKANWPSAKSLQICFLNSTTIVGNCVGFKNGVYGFNQTNVTSYQQIVIPLSAFALGSTVADRLRFQVIGSGGSIGFYLDWIQIQSTLSGSGGSSFQLQVNGQNTQQTANLVNSGTVTFSHVPGLNGVDAILATASGSSGLSGMTAGQVPIAATASTVTSSTPLQGTDSSILTSGTISASTGVSLCTDANHGATTTGCSSGGITSINTSATGPAVTITGSGGANVTTSGNTVTINGSLGPPGASWQNIGGNPTVSGSDNTWRDRFTAAGAAITLPAPNTIATNPIVARRYVSGTFTTSPQTTSTFTQSAGNQLFITISNVNTGPTQTVSTVTDSAGDSCSRLVADATGGPGATAVSMWYCTNIAAAGSNAVTITWAGNPGAAQVQVLELTGTSLDTASAADNSTLTNTVHFANALAIDVEANFNNPPPGFIVSFGAGNQGLATRLLQNQSQVTVTSVNSPTSYAMGLVVFAITSAPSFTAGWYFIAENASTGNQVITPASSTINGQSTLVLAPNEVCGIMSNGANYDATCGFAPNLQTNGVTGGSVTVFAADQTAGTASIGATTMYATASAPVSRYHFGGYADVTVVGSSCAGNTTVVLNLIYTDPNTSSTTTLALGTFTITTNGTVGTSNMSFPPVMFKAKGSTNIQFSTTYTAGGSCSPAPTVQVTPVLQVM